MQALEANSDEIMRALPEMLRSLLERQERMKAAADDDEAPGGGAILRRTLELSPADQRELETTIRRLGRQLGGAQTRRLRVARTGKVSVAHTLRRNMAYEGVPFKPVLRRRRESRPRLVVLCDVSLSTRNLARFWLQLVYELQSLFSRVRTFAFVADLVEVTQLFEEQGLGRRGGDAVPGRPDRRRRELRLRPLRRADAQRLPRRGEPPHDGGRARRRPQQRAAARTCPPWRRSAATPAGCSG